MARIPSKEVKELNYQPLSYWVLLDTGHSGKTEGGLYLPQQANPIESLPVDLPLRLVEHGDNMSEEFMAWKDYCKKNSEDVYLYLVPGNVNITLKLNEKYYVLAREGDIAAFAVEGFDRQKYEERKEKEKEERSRHLAEIKRSGIIPPGPVVGKKGTY